MPRSEGSCLRASLVHDDQIDGADDFEYASVTHQNAAARGGRHGCGESHRSGDAERAGQAMTSTAMVCIKDAAGLLVRHGQAANVRIASANTAGIKRRAMRSTEFHRPDDAREDGR